jgi:polyhydroxyalkanoate synthesis repressor PhaR
MADNTAPAAEHAADRQQPAPVVVKKYANRRLYNTETSSYVTLEDLATMVRGGRDFAVYDAKSGEDITRSVLTQIIVEEESKGRSLLPESFLRHLIGFYGDSLQTVLPRYLDLAMAGFARQQEQMRRSVEQAMGGFLPFGGLEEMGKQQKAMMERAMSLFSPFLPPEPPSSSAPNVEALQSEIASLKEQLEALRAAGAPPATGKEPARRSPGGS